jgi:hypothetical protein
MIFAVLQKSRKVGEVEWLTEKRLSQGWKVVAKLIAQNASMAKKDTDIVIVLKGFVLILLLL